NPLRTWPPGGPVDQFDRMNDGYVRARCELRDAADIARCNHVRSQSLDSPDFALAQPSCDIGLQNIVGSGGAAAQMTFGYVFHHKTKLGEKVSRLAGDALPVLEGTGRMVGDNKAG